jgi:hypothetical protein
MKIIAIYNDKKTLSTKYLTTKQDLLLYCKSIFEMNPGHIKVYHDKHDIKIFDFINGNRLVVGLTKTDEFN